MNLTNAAIGRFSYKGDASKTQWDVRWDDTIPGFGVRIYPSGKKAFVLSYRFRRRKRLMVFGRFGADLTLSQARDRARKYRVNIIDGKDPLEEKRPVALSADRRPQKRTSPSQVGRCRSDSGAVAA